MGVKLGRWHWGRNVGCGCLRLGCWGEYLGVRGRGNREWRKLHNEELRDLYSLPNIVRLVKSRRMGWAGYVARMGSERGVHRVLVGKSPYGGRFSAPVQTGFGAHPARCTMGTGSFPGIKSGLGVTLTRHPLLVPWSWKGRTIPLLPLWAVRPVQSLSACTRVTFTFYVYITLLFPFVKCAKNSDPLAYVVNFIFQKIFPIIPSIFYLT